MAAEVGTIVPDVAKIAVLRANALGDYIFSLPALDSLRAAYPDAEVVLLGAPWHARVLAGRPGPVDRVVPVPPLPGIHGGETGGPDAERAAARFRDWARAERFDLALQLHGGGRYSNPVVAGLGARVTAGLRAADAMPLDRCLPYVYYQPEVFRYLEVVGLVGVEPLTFQPRFALTDEDRAEAAPIIGTGDRPLAALHPGASDARRRWPDPYFAAVGDALAKAGARVLITGTGGERDIIDRVQQAMRFPAEPVVDAVSIGGLGALFAACAVVVANDTGPLHLADAVGAATVGLYWVGNMINGASVHRGRSRPLISWTIHCPECGLDCTRDIYPARTGGAGCRHSPSFVADIPAVEAIGEALELLHGATPDRTAFGVQAGAAGPSRVMR
jgi:ADP-heptose:LPS heptosyltransferase